MSTAPETTQLETERPDRGVLHRTFAVDVTAGEGRTIDVRIVPYGQTCMAADGLGGLPRGVPYEEEWAPGAFSGQERAAHRVLMNVEHEPGIRGVVGHGIALREAADGFYGSFKAHETPEGDKALMLTKEGVFGGVSLEAYPKKSLRTAAGVVRRIKGHLDAIALCREPAFADAVVLAVRQHVVLDDELLPIAPDPEAIERCRRLGIALPQRYQTHQADADTSAQTADTPDASPVDVVNSDSTEDS